jgi:hypothetical protein
MTPAGPPQLNSGTRESRTTVPIAAVLRRFVLALLFLGMTAVTIELILLDHTDGWQQDVPFVALGLGFVACTAAAVRPGRRSLLFMRAIMLLFVLAGIAGIYLHYTGNAEFELEMYPSLKGRQLLWNSLTGATPVGAPGYLTQLGLLGLIYTFRHPRLAPRGKEDQTETEES